MSPHTFLKIEQKKYGTRDLGKTSMLLFLCTAFLKMWLNIFTRQLSGLVVERWPAALEAGVQTRGGEPMNFQYRLSSAETQQPVDRMRRKARGCLVLSVLC